jgi:hypothetical protein
MPALLNPAEGRYGERKGKIVFSKIFPPER